MSILGFLFLTHDELVELTDLKIPSAQIRWLKSHAYPFEIGASGKPKVLRSLLIQRLEQLAIPAKQSEPNFDAIR